MTTTRPKRNVRNATPAPPVEDDATIVRTTLDRIIYTVDVIARFDQTRRDIAAVHRGESDKSMAQVMTESRWHEYASKAKKECPLGSTSKKKRSYDDEQDEDEEEDDPNAPSTSTKIAKTPKPTPEKKSTPSKAKLAAIKKKADAARRKAQREAKKLEALGDKEDGEDPDESFAMPTLESAVDPPSESVLTDGETSGSEASKQELKSQSSMDDDSKPPEIEAQTQMDRHPNSQDDEVLEKNKNELFSLGSTTTIAEQHGLSTSELVVSDSVNQQYMSQEYINKVPQIQELTLHETEMQQRDTDDFKNSFSELNTDDLNTEKATQPVQSTSLEEGTIKKELEQLKQSFDSTSEAAASSMSSSETAVLQKQITSEDPPTESCMTKTANINESEIGEPEAKKPRVQDQKIIREFETFASETHQYKNVEEAGNSHADDDIPEYTPEQLILKPWLANELNLYPLNLLPPIDNLPGRVWCPPRGWCKATAERVVKIGPLTELETLDLSLCPEFLELLDQDRADLILKRMLKLQILNLKIKAIDPKLSENVRDGHIKQLECYEKQLEEVLEKDALVRLKVLCLPHEPMTAIPKITESIVKYTKFDPTWYTSSRHWFDKSSRRKNQVTQQDFLDQFQQTDDQVILDFQREMLEKAKQIEEEAAEERIRSFQLPLIYDLHKQPPLLRERMLEFRHKLARFYQYEDFEKTHMTDPACREIWRKLRPIPFENGVIMDEAEEELTALISTYKKQFAAENPVIPLPQAGNERRPTNAEIKRQAARCLMDVIDTVVIRDLTDLPTYPHRIPAHNRAI